MKTIRLLAFLLLPLVPMVIAQNKSFTDDLMFDSCSFASTGRNRYFILEPGYQLVLENKKGGRLVVTVLDQTKRVGNVETRIVEENESENGKTTEVSRNFFAFCRETSSVYYFGEEVDIYKNGQIEKHEGAWTAEGPNKAGIAMPGLILVGSRYYQELAPGVAMDRAEIISLSETRQTPAGSFKNCLKTEESSPLELGTREFKYYAPGIGLIQDENLSLTKYGYIKK